MKKEWPVLISDEDAERFVTEADLSDYDFSKTIPMPFEFKAKTATVSMRMPKQLLDAVKAEAAKTGVPYQRYIRQALERVLNGGK